MISTYMYILLALYLEVVCAQYDIIQKYKLFCYLGIIYFS